MSLAITEKRNRMITDPIRAWNVPHYKQAAFYRYIE
jgi:hypothetical protein